MRLRLTDYTHTRVNTQVLPALMQSAAKNLIGELSRKKRKGYCYYFDILFLIILRKTNLEMGIYIFLIVVCFLVALTTTTLKITTTNLS